MNISQRTNNTIARINYTTESSNCDKVNTFVNDKLKGSKTFNYRLKIQVSHFWGSISHLGDNN